MLLATISHPAHNLSQSMRYSRSPTSSGTALQEPATPVENKVCPGCQLTVMDENGGVVIAFGQSFFHVDCFQCAKCKDKVTADTNLLLLSDGQPVCSNCSYSCSVCHQPILDEAIMTGDDSYHAHCFKCRSCHNRIDELMFAKTSHGIYCMNCHHQRVARSRRHAQKQKERENAVREARSHVHPIKEEESVPPANAPTGLFTPDSALNALSVSTTSSAQTSPTRSRPATSPVIGDSDRSQPQSSQNGRRDERRSAPSPYTNFLQSSHRSSQNMLPSPTSPSAVSPQANSNTPPAYPSGPPSPIVVVPPQVPEAGPQVALSYIQHEDSNGNGTATPFLTPGAPTSSLERRRSYDDGTRPLNILFKDTPPPGSAHSDKLSGTELNNKPFSAPQSPSRPPSFDKGQISDHTDTRPLPLRAQTLEGLSRQPSRRAHAEAPASAPAVTGSMLNRSRSRTASSPKPPPGSDPMSVSSRQDMMPERLPPRTHSLKRSTQDSEAKIRHRPSTTSIKISAPGRSSDENDRPKPGSSLSIDVEKSRAGYGKRPTSPAYKASSPAHKVDVPHSIESGTDTSDGERELSANDRTRNVSLPSKEQETTSRRRPVHLELDVKQSASREEHGEGVSFLSSGGDADSEGESSPVERVSRSTFIAPAHPPIRFSVSGNGFQELLSQVDPRNRSSLLIIEELVKLNQDAETRLDGDRSPASLTPNGGPAQTEGGRSSTPASALTPTTSVSAPDNSSVTTISAPSSQGHDDTSMVLDHSVTTNGAEHALLRQRSMRNALSPPSSRSSSERSHDRAASEAGQHGHLDPNVFAHHTNGSLSGISSQFAASESSITRPGKLDPSYAVAKRLQDALQDAARRGTTQIALDQEFVQTVVMMIEQRRDENAKMKGRLDHIKRASQRVMGGLVSFNEYGAEQKARRDAEAEVTRLRVLLSGQAARITALSGQGRRDDLHKQLLRDLRDNLNDLEQDVAKLKVERDVALVEMEEIASSRGSAGAVEMDGTGLSRSLSTRLDNLKAQYKGELVSLIDERESLFREIAELQSARDVFLEETTMLNARNEELAQLNAHYMQRIEAISSESSMPAQEKRSSERERERQHPSLALQSSHTVNSSIGASSDEGADLGKYTKGQQKPSTGDVHSRVFKWRGNNKETNAAASAAHTQDSLNEKTWLGHAFQQVSVLRLSKCDHCGEKLWGSQARCQACHISVHPRCQPNVYVVCSPQHSSRRDDGPGPAPGTLQPTMFGRELTEQVRVDSKVTERMVPLIVERCIAAVEANALDYEGVYRKTGGSAQSKLVTQLFERGDYSAFDLLDEERFNDICSVTSVLKSYLRALPNPLLTFVLHDEFIYAASIQDSMHKSAKYADLVKQLPTEHYYTLRALMYHLHRIQEHHAENLMTARNLGVVFGPTLMRSRNPAAEFSDMAGKALTIEWLVEKAPTLFPPLSTSH